MQKPKMNFSDLPIDKTWTLFLDRDGVVNRRIVGGYVLSVDEFEILPGVLEAISFFGQIFGRIVVVTNQQCVGKGLLTIKELNQIHQYFLKKVEENNGRIDKIYFAPQLHGEKSIMRKPAIGMALQAQSDFPEIDFNKSIMVGDAVSDMKFGKNAGMVTVFIGNDKPELAGFVCSSLGEFGDWLQKG